MTAGVTAPTGLMVVDADAHVNEPVVRPEPPSDEMRHWLRLAELHPGWQRPGQSGGATVSLIGDKLYPTQEGPGRGVPVGSAINPAVAAGSVDLQARLADLDAEGIGVQVLFGGLCLGATTFDDLGLAVDFCRAYNDWLLDLCAGTQGRLRAAAVIPLQDVTSAVAEVQRAAAMEAVAVTVPPVLAGTNLDHPTLLPVFEAAADADVAVAVHGAPGMHVPLPAADRFENYAQVHCLSFPVEQMVALTALAMGGVLDRVPGLRVAFLESGIGWVPYYVHRMAEHREKRGSLVPSMTSHPRDYISRGQCFFSFECEEPMLAAYIDELGHESLVFSSDYPHWDCEAPGMVGKLLDRTSGLDDAVRRAVAGENALRLYGLAGTAPAAPAASASTGSAGTGSASTAGQPAPAAPPVGSPAQAS